VSNPNATIYQGTKQLKAWPMNKATYCDYRGWPILADEDPNEPGYLVEYLDGGKSNDARHEGYISWSPADVFEKAYRLCGSHVERMAIEMDELVERGDKLNAFMQTPTFDLLSEEEQFLLIAQMGTMTTYASLLARRISIEEAKDNG
jgi:hypothetical protein